MNIKKTFLDLTEYNISYGDEYKLEHLLPNYINIDEFGNYFLKIGNSRTMFTAHLDDASWGGYTKVNHIYDKDFIRTDYTSILGADDKAGVTILLYMIHHNIPGTYYFFLGEESGMVGSSGIVKIKKDSFSKDFDRCISFDRRGYGSIISRQMGRNSCSDIFINDLKEQFNNLNLPHKKDPTGIYTDSAAFIGIIPECTNISVGYFDEHSYLESQNIRYLEKLCKTVIKIKWEELSTDGTIDNEDEWGYIF